MVGLTTAEHDIHNRALILRLTGTETQEYYYVASTYIYLVDIYVHVFVGKGSKGVIRAVLIEKLFFPYL